MSCLLNFPLFPSRQSSLSGLVVANLVGPDHRGVESGCNLSGPLEIFTVTVPGRGLTLSLEAPTSGLSPKGGEGFRGVH